MPEDDTVEKEWSIDRSERCDISAKFLHEHLLRLHDVRLRVVVLLARESAGPFAIAQQKDVGVRRYDAANAPLDGTLARAALEGATLRSTL